MTDGYWIVECQRCHGAFVEYHGPTKPGVDDRIEDSYAHGYLRHADGRVVQLGDDARCDSCGSGPWTETIVHEVGGELVDSVTIKLVAPFLHPDYFKWIAPSWAVSK